MDWSKKRRTRWMDGWGIWRGERELLRGLFHALVGIAGWVALHFFGASLEMGGILLFGVGTTLFLADQYRVWLGRNGVDETSLVGQVHRWVARNWARDTEARQPSSSCFSALLSVWCELVIIELRVKNYELRIRGRVNKLKIINNHNLIHNS